MGFLKSLFTRSGSSNAELFKLAPPPSDQAVTGAEAALAISFPSSFIAFMRKQREMRLPICARFYWVGDESLEHNIIAANQREREEVSVPLPNFLIAFYDDGMGNQVCFDTRRRSAAGEYPIVFWDHELTAEENIAASQQVARNRESAGIVASSFDGWLEVLTISEASS